MASVVSVVLFLPSFNVLSSYFYVSLVFNGHFQIPNLAEFRDTLAPLKPGKYTAAIYIIQLKINDACA